MPALSHCSKTHKEVRTACRTRWGKDWWKCHPVIKKARLAWGLNGHDPRWSVRVTDEDGVYTV